MPLVIIVTNGQIEDLDATRNAPFDDKLSKEATWRILRPRAACVVAGQYPIEAIAKYHSPMRGQQLLPRIESRRVNQPGVPILLPKGRIEGVIVWLGEPIGCVAPPNLFGRKRCSSHLDEHSSRAIDADGN
jgi:hypothetical protein